MLSDSLPGSQMRHPHNGILVIEFGSKWHVRQLEMVSSGYVESDGDRIEEVSGYGRRTVSRACRTGSTR